MIEGVICKELATFPDERGYFRELIRSSDGFFAEGFGQLSHSLMYSGVIKAWHYHRTQTDWWYVVSGVLRAVLCDLRPESPTHRRVSDFLLGDLQPAQVVKIPPGVAHGCKVLQGPVHLLYVTSAVYNQADEFRIAHDAIEIGYDWLKGPEIT
jgi:dTDP-4-dehydrorhamnose 3,5-epimerase